MQPFKLEHFKRDHPGAPLPDVERVREVMRRALRAQLAERVGCSPVTDNLALTRRVVDSFASVEGVNAKAEDFILSEVLVY